MVCSSITSHLSFEDMDPSAHGFSSDNCSASLRDPPAFFFPTRTLSIVPPYRIQKKKKKERERDITDISAIAVTEGASAR